MDMFGGLTKTSSRIAIAAALGLVVGGFAFKATPARAADLGGDCCADLEERVAELEATTVRKGNKKVSVTLSGWVVKSMNFWDDGDVDSFFVGDKGYDLGSRFAITGSATIAPGWSGGFNLTMLATSDLFATSGTLANSNQFFESGGTFFDMGLNPLYSYIYIKSDKWGTLNWGHLSPASDNPAVLADISGTVIESNAVFFEGASFFLRAKGNPSGLTGLTGLQWEDFLLCQGLGLGIGTDCFGAAMPAVRYDSPTWGGFRFETSYGTNTLTPAGFPVTSTTESNFWDIAGFYTADWNSIKLSAAAAYTWQESGALTDEEVDLFQVGASVMHKPSGLGIYGLYQTEDSSGSQTNVVDPFPGFITNVTINNPDTDAWYLKPFWRKTWSPIGATTLYGEYGQYNDQFNAGFGNLCFRGFGPGTNVGAFCAPFSSDRGVFITDSEVQRWGLGVVQEIDSAAMHLWARWQHQEVDLSLLAVESTFNPVFGCLDGCKINQGFDHWDLFQVGGIIFF
jgi:hypothetical protein